MPALRFKTCRLLPGNVRNREITIIQRHILRKLRNKKRFLKKKIYPKKNLNSYIQSQTTRKLPLFHGNLPITKMHRGTERTSYIPFLLNPETRLDVIPVRLHFCETIPQARQPISHRKVCLNNFVVKITHFYYSSRWSPVVKIMLSILCLTLWGGSSSFVEEAECAGNSGEGASTSFPRHESEMALDMPANEPAPEAPLQEIDQDLIWENLDAQERAGG